MQTTRINSAARGFESFRVRQVAGMFDLPVESASPRVVSAEVPGPAEEWRVGVIVGPSGCGKSTLARAAFGRWIAADSEWPADRAVVDAVGEHPIRRIVRAFTAVGLGSPPVWVRPFATLSTGERFRANLARTLLAAGEHQPVVIDEYASPVDRVTARFASAALGRAVRGGVFPVRLVAVTCHDDVVPWLEPDWVLDLGRRRLSRGPVRRPRVRLSIERTTRDVWRVFEPHHYLSGTLHPAAQCYVGTVEGEPAAFTAVLPFPHPRRPGWREHRTVCLPQYQGVGIGAALSDTVAGLYAAGGKPYFSTTSHPAMIAHRARSPHWRMHRAPGFTGRPGRRSRDHTAMADTCSRGRITAGFEYVGPTNAALPKTLSL